MTKEQQEAALKLANHLLDPEGGGLSVGPWERDMARLAIGLPPVECKKPRLRYSQRYWFCGVGGIVWHVGATPDAAFENWLRAKRKGERDVWTAEICC